MTATITADKGSGAIRLVSSRLEGVVEGLEGVEPAQLREVAQAAEDACTISNAIRCAVPVTLNVAAT